MIVAMQTITTTANFVQLEISIFPPPELSLKTQPGLPGKLQLRGEDKPRPSPQKGLILPSRGQVKGQGDKTLP